MAELGREDGRGFWDWRSTAGCGEWRGGASARTASFPNAPHASTDNCNDSRPNWSRLSHNCYCGCTCLGESTAGCKLLPDCTRSCQFFRHRLHVPRRRHSRKASPRDLTKRPPAQSAPGALLVADCCAKIGKGLVSRKSSGEVRTEQGGRAGGEGTRRTALAREPHERLLDVVRFQADRALRVIHC